MFTWLSAMYSTRTGSPLFGGEWRRADGAVDARHQGDQEVAEAMTTRSRPLKARYEAVGFAGHYDFDSGVLAAYRTTGKCRAEERQVLIVRYRVLAGRSFFSVEKMDAAFEAWMPQRRSQIHKTYREAIGERVARDRAALKLLPPMPYLVAERHLRPVGKSCPVAFGGNPYSVPARKVRPRQLVENRVAKSRVMLPSTVFRTPTRAVAGTAERRIRLMKCCSLPSSTSWSADVPGANCHAASAY
ncbi:hypothetical protein ACFVT5_15325 [Streptomyces sp. NPDC058001]|uniref:Mu transposase domain-containing protein n=1 Tax=Streptomyces sp. NPDC058001 TaxID=3346300 RepID=UPI0036EC6AD6